ncbi:MAG: hypothetical protein J0M12_07525 [Deltaproteobacteria bacterium]|nr:hypothetical protein [Deltaproteobacteria bacterium]
MKLSFNVSAKSMRRVLLAGLLLSCIAQFFVAARTYAQTKPSLLAPNRKYLYTEDSKGVKKTKTKTIAAITRA